MLTEVTELQFSSALQDRLPCFYFAACSLTVFSLTDFRRPKFSLESLRWESLPKILRPNQIVWVELYVVIEE